MTADKKLGAGAAFDKQRATDAVEAFDAAQLPALVVAGYLPGALARIEELEEVCRGCLRIIEGVPQPTLTLRAIETTLALRAIEACLRGGLLPGKVPVGSRIEQQRLRDGALALAASSTLPETATEVRVQLRIVGEGIAALQSLDDLGEGANAQAARDQQELWRRYEALGQRIKELEAK